MAIVVVMDKPKSTTIQVSFETKNDLQSLGGKGETYDEIVQRLIKIYRETKET
jgi:hypothetical protein